MLLDVFQMLYTTGPLLLFNLMLLFYILLIHLEGLKLWPAFKKYRFLEKLNHSKNKIIFFFPSTLLKEPQVK